jgi:hypothetical protein
LQPLLRRPARTGRWIDPPPPGPVLAAGLVMAAAELLPAVEVAVAVTMP